MSLQNDALFKKLRTQDVGCPLIVFTSNKSEKLLMPLAYTGNAANS